MSENQFDSANNDDRVGQKRLCHRCIGETFLKEEAKRLNQVSTCSYCSSQGEAIAISEFAKLVEVALDHHYQRVSDQSPQEVERNWDNEGELIAEVIADTAKIDKQAAEDTRSFLANRECLEACAEPFDSEPFEADVHYIETEPNDAVFHNQWVSFEHILKEEARFFSRKTFAFLDSIFADLLNHKTSSGQSVIIDAGPAKIISELYRARVFQSDNKLIEALTHPDVEIGPPPSRIVKSGRMNPLGISVFYGSRDIDTAIAEVRPPVGSRTVTASFKIIRPIRLLDVNALRLIKKQGSIFDPTYLNQLQQANFLRTLSDLISRPVMPDDELFEYITTQAIASYLDTEIGLDGIIYPSAQTGKGSSNIVLFHRAAFVEPIIISEKLRLHANLYDYDEDGRTEEYTVVETILNNPPEPSSLMESPIEEPTLKVNLESLTVHRVFSSEFSKGSLPVNRVQITERKHDPNKPDQDLF